MVKLEKEFYTRDTLDVAKDLLGKYLVVDQKDKKMIVRIVETEGYIGPIDKASHTYNNRRTKRTEVMYYSGGHVYIYQIYGLYFCLNIVTEDETVGTAVLIRGGEPIEGLEQMAVNRYDKGYNELSNKEKKNLTNGPGKLCKALALDKTRNGESLLNDEIYICEMIPDEKIEMIHTKRVNIDYAEEAKDYNWRFYIKNNKFVSKK